VTGFFGALAEAWDELRINKLRVLLALIGVTAAVAAITGVTAAVDMLGQAFKEDAERSAGRPVTLELNAWQNSEATDPTPFETAAEQAIERYGIEYSSRFLYQDLTVRFPSGTTTVTSQAVDPDLGTIKRIVPTQGRWFTETDAQAFAPVLVVNEAFMRAFGLADLATHPTVTLGSQHPVRATVIGVVADQWSGEAPTVTWLYDHFTRWSSGDPLGPGAPTYLIWVPPDQADVLSVAIRRDVSAAAPDWEVELYDNRMGGYDSLDGAVRWVGLGVGAFALLLGGLGLLNISLVTVRYRIREIGIRRSFGATSPRIFFGVVMESVVATMVAGAVGVALAVAGIKTLPIDRVLGAELQDIPPFPLSAALTGLGAALLVGLLAGVIPAMRAVRVKVIDAIRY
jgi:putative ABC transport system permease protein